MVLADIRHGKIGWWIDANSGGNAQIQIWKRNQLPRIFDEYLNSAFYIYPSRASAESAEVGQGASGFFVALPSEQFPEDFHLYAVTNWHVVREAKTPTLRLNTKQGKVEFVDTDMNDWIRHPDGDDIVVLPMRMEIDAPKYNFVPREGLITKEFIAEHDVGPGDEVFMVGRFVFHEGKKRNLPSVRSGIISIMPEEPVKTEVKEEQEAFFVEMRSIGGYSGSPAFVYLPPFTMRGKKGVSTEWFIQLLGVDCGHLPLKIDLENSSGRIIGKAKIGNAMTVVIPAWKLEELLYIEELSTQRKEEDQRIADELQDAAVLDNTAEEAQFIKEDFEDALKKVSRPQEPPSEEEKPET